RLDLGEGGGGADIGLGPRQGNEGSDRQHDQAGGQDQGVLVALVALHEPYTHQGAGYGDQDQQDPVPGVPVQPGVVIADHGEKHGQGEIGVMDRALAAHQRILGIGGAAFFLGLHQLALAGDDHVVDVEHHYG